MNRFLNLKQTSENDIELRIEGDIIPPGKVWFYKDFGEPYTALNEFRAELKKHSGKNIAVWINSNGGDIATGFAIYSALKEFSGEKVVKIDGIAASIASVIAMAGDKVLMSPASLMMGHLPYTEVEGDAHELEKEINALNACKETILNAYEIKTKLPRAKLSGMIENEFWLSPQKAIELGFADGFLYEDAEKRDYSNMISGARLVFNCLKRDRAANYSERAEPNKADSEGGILFAAARLNLEKEKNKF